MMDVIKFVWKIKFVSFFFFFSSSSNPSHHNRLLKIVAACIFQTALISLLSLSIFLSDFSFFMLSFMCWVQNISESMKYPLSIVVILFYCIRCLSKCAMCFITIKILSPKLFEIDFFSRQVLCKFVNTIISDQFLVAKFISKKNCNHLYDSTSKYLLINLVLSHLHALFQLSKYFRRG